MYYLAHYSEDESDASDKTYLQGAGEPIKGITAINR